MRALSLAAALCVSLLASASHAQSDATPEELALIDAWVDQRVAATRGRASDESLVAERRRALLSALARGATVDLVAVRAEVTRRLADVEARLAEVGRSCGSFPDPAPARARRDALLEVARALADGPFTAP